MRGHFQRNIVAGVFTLIPFVVTFVVVDFLLKLLARVGRPFVVQTGNALQETYPAVAEILVNPVIQSVVAVLMVIAALYALGVLATQVIGRQIRRLFDYVINQIPFVSNIYGIVRRTLETFEQKDSVQRVVLIDFPTENMKAIGLLTRTLQDEKTGEEMAAVFVPTTPNPTNGFLEIVPAKYVTPTDWEMDEAISFLISGGADGPDKVPFFKDKMLDEVPNDAGLNLTDRDR